MTDDILARADWFAPTRPIRVPIRGDARSEPARQFAMSAMNPLADLLGLDYQTDGVATAPQGPRNPLARGMGAGADYLQRYPDVARHYDTIDPRELRWMGERGFGGRDGWARFHYENAGQREGRNWGPEGPTPLPAVTDAPAAAGAGVGSGQRTQNALAALQARPGYQFRMDEGMRALDSSAAARGMVSSGANIRGALEYGQDYASNEYDREINRLQSVLGGQQVAVNQQNNSASNYANAAAGLSQNTGAARASAYQQQGAAAANAWGGVTNNLLTGVGAYGQHKGWFG